MATFDKRKDAFESKFARDEELRQQVARLCEGEARHQHDEHRHALVEPRLEPRVEEPVRQHRERDPPHRAAPFESWLSRKRTMASTSAWTTVF